MWDSPAVVGAAAGVAGFGASVIGTVAILSWRSRSIIAELERQIDERHDEFVKMHGDSLMAMRQKIVDTELWNRDNFVRTNQFSEFAASVNRAFELMRADMKEELHSINDKLDRWQK